MLLWIVLVLWAVSTAQADLDSLKGTTNTFDCFLSSSEATANSDTLNYGVTDGKVIGWSSSNTFYGHFLFGAKCSTTVAGISALGHTIDSIRVRLYNYTASSANVSLRAYRAPSNWNEGTGNGTASPTNGASMKYKGTGTAWSGEAASGQWAGYVTQTDDDFNLSSYTDFGIVAGDPATTMQATGYYWWNVTDQFQDSFAVGQYDVSILFADTVHTTLAAHERLGIYASEKTVDSLQPTILFYHSLHIEPDSTFLRVAVTIPFGSTTDLPVLVNWLTFNQLGQGKASTRFTVYAADSTTKLYWCLDSLAGAYTRIWVGGSNADWGASDSIFISTESNPSYQNCDSVFLFYESFDTEFQVTRLVDTLTEGDRIARDTVNGGTPYLDVLNEGLTWMYENSNTVTTDSGYLQILCGGFTSPYDGNTDPQDSTFGFVYRSFDLETWTAEGMIVCPRSASGLIPAEDTVRIQDAYLLQDDDTLRLVFEDKRIYNTRGSYDLIGMLTSTDHGVSWTYRGVLVDSLLWDSEECSPSSPILWKIGSEYFLAGECKNGSYTDNSGVAQPTTAGAIYMAYGTDLYNLSPMFETDTGLGYEIPAIPFTTAYNYGCVPDAHWIEGETHFLAAHTQHIVSVPSVDTLGWGVTVWSCSEDSLTAHIADWTRLDILSRNTEFWGDSSVTYRALADDPQPFVVDGKYWINTTHRGGANPDSIITMNWCPVVNWDTTGNPYDLTYYRKESLGAIGFVHIQDGILHVVPEPYSERSSVGVVTVDSFQTNFAVDVRYRFPYPTHRVYTSISMGNGVPVAYTDSVGFSATNYEVTNLKDGWYFLYNYGTEQIVPGTQPVLDNRTTGTAYSAPTYSSTNWNTFSFAVVGNGTADTVRSGFQYNLTNATRYDTADVDYKRIGIFAGTYLYDETNGGVEIDRLQVRKTISGGFSTHASDTLWAMNVEVQGRSAFGRLVLTERGRGFVGRRGWN